MDTTHVAVDGWADAIPAPGPRGTATFDLIVRPADADTTATDTPDTVVSCTSGAPQITHALLTDIQPGDLLRDGGAGTLSIGALAARFGLATHVLRHWEAMGLLHPGRDAGGRRRYGADDLTRVATILILKEAGLGLNTIRSLSATVDRTTRHEILHPAAEELRSRIAAAHRRAGRPSKSSRRAGGRGRGRGTNLMRRHGSLNQGVLRRTWR